MIEILETSTFKIAIDSENHFWRKVLSRKGQYQGSNLSYVRSRFPTGARTIVDVGANLGMNTLAYSKMAKMVVAVEPQPQVFALLLQNLELNRITNVCPIETCVGSSCGQVDIECVDSSNSGLARVASDKVRSRRPTLKVAMTALDALYQHNWPLLESNPLAETDFIKIDVEGMEVAVIRGALALIKDCRPLIQTEVIEKQLRQYGESAYSLQEVMRSLDYVPYLRTGKRLLEIEKKPRWAADIFWVPLT